MAPPRSTSSATCKDFGFPPKTPSDLLVVLPTRKILCDLQGFLLAPRNRGPVGIVQTGTVCYLAPSHPVIGVQYECHTDCFSSACAFRGDVCTMHGGLTISKRNQRHQHPSVTPPTHQRGCRWNKSRIQSGIKPRVPRRGTVNDPASPEEPNNCLVSIEHHGDTKIQIPCNLSWGFG